MTRISGATAASDVKRADRTQLVTFRVGEDLFAADIFSVERVLRFTVPRPIPNVPAWLEGVMDYGGRVVPVIDLRTRFELGAASARDSARILVVEDNLPNRELLCDWLEAEGFETLSAGDLEEAVAVFKNDPPDVVLLDVQLGSQDGLSLAAWIRRDPKLRAIPVIAVTAHAMVTDQQRVMEAGCSACVSKPIDFRMLRNELDRWLVQPSKLRPSR